MIRSLLQGVQFTVTARESTKGNLRCLQHCRASLGLAGCRADFINPAVLWVAQVSSLVLEKKSILISAKTHGELIYACESNGPDSALSPLRFSADIPRSGLSDRVAACININT